MIEHIAGAIDDSAAMKLMYSRLRPGGRLIVTTMLDHESRDEFRGEDVYGTQPGTLAGYHVSLSAWRKRQPVSMGILIFAAL